MSASQTLSAHRRQCVAQSDRLLALRESELVSYLFGYFQDRVTMLRRGTETFCAAPDTLGRLAQFLRIHDRLQQLNMNQKAVSQFEREKRISVKSLAKVLSIVRKYISSVSVSLAGSQKQLQLHQQTSTTLEDAKAIVVDLQMFASLRALELIVDDESFVPLGVTFFITGLRSVKHNMQRILLKKYLPVPTLAYLLTSFLEPHDNNNSNGHSLISSHSSSSSSDALSEGKHYSSSSSNSGAAAQVVAHQEWENLEFLSVRYGKLTSIDESVLLVPKLELIDLSYNEIEVIENLHHCIHLKHVNLGHNRISSLENVHINIGNIKSLILRNNRISDVSPLQKCFSLESLDLSHNDIDDCDKVYAALKRMPFLSHVWLTANPISKAKSYRLAMLVCCRESLSNLAHGDADFYLDNILVSKEEMRTSMRADTDKVIAEAQRQMLREFNLSPADVNDKLYSSGASGSDAVAETNGRRSRAASEYSSSESAQMHRARRTRRVVTIEAPSNSMETPEELERDKWMKQQSTAIVGGGTSTSGSQHQASLLTNGGEERGFSSHGAAAVSASGPILEGESAEDVMRRETRAREDRLGITAFRQQVNNLRMEASSHWLTHLNALQSAQNQSIIQKNASSSADSSSSAAVSMSSVQQGTVSHDKPRQMFASLPPTETPAPPVDSKTTTMPTTSEDPRDGTAPEPAVSEQAPVVKMAPTPMRSRAQARRRSMDLLEATASKASVEEKKFASSAAVINVNHVANDVVVGAQQNDGANGSATVTSAVVVEAAPAVVPASVSSTSSILAQLTADTLRESSSEEEDDETLSPIPSPLSSNRQLDSIEALATPSTSAALGSMAPPPGPDVSVRDSALDVLAKSMTSLDVALSDSFAVDASMEGIGSLNEIDLVVRRLFYGKNESEADSSNSSNRILNVSEEKVMELDARYCTPVVEHSNMHVVRVVEDAPQATDAKSKVLTLECAENDDDGREQGRKRKIQLLRYALVHGDEYDECVDCIRSALVSHAKEGKTLPVFAEPETTGRARLSSTSDLRSRPSFTTRASASNSRSNSVASRIESPVALMVQPSPDVPSPKFALHDDDVDAEAKHAMTMKAKEASNPFLSHFYSLLKELRDGQRESDDAILNDVLQKSEEFTARQNFMRQQRTSTEEAEYICHIQSEMVILGDSRVGLFDAKKLSAVKWSELKLDETPYVLLPDNSHGNIRLPVWIVFTTDGIRVIQDLRQTKDGSVDPIMELCCHDLLDCRRLVFGYHMLYFQLGFETPCACKTHVFTVADRMRCGKIINLLQRRHHERSQTQANSIHAHEGGDVKVLTILDDNKIVSEMLRQQVMLGDDTQEVQLYQFALHIVAPDNGEDSKQETNVGDVIMRNNSFLSPNGKNENRKSSDSSDSSSSLGDSPRTPKQSSWAIRSITNNRITQGLKGLISRTPSEADQAKKRRESRVVEPMEVAPGVYQRTVCVTRDWVFLLGERFHLPHRFVIVAGMRKTQYTGLTTQYVSVDSGMVTVTLLFENAPSWQLVLASRSAMIALRSALSR